MPASRHAQSPSRRRSFRRQRAGNFASPHPPPIKTLEESLELGLAKPDHPVLDPGPREAVPARGACRSSPARFRPRPEAFNLSPRFDRKITINSRIDVETELSRRSRRESVMAPAKINRPGRHHDAKRDVGENHDARPSPKARATIRSTGLSTGRRTTTPSASIATAWSGDAPSTTSGTNGGPAPPTPATGRSPASARRRHLRRVLSLIPWRRATAEGEAPGS